MGHCRVHLDLRGGHSSAVEAFDCSKPRVQLGEERGPCNRGVLPGRWCLCLWLRREECLHDLLDNGLDSYVVNHALYEPLSHLIESLHVFGKGVLNHHLCVFYATIHYLHFLVEEDRIFYGLLQVSHLIV